jgi:hypothetical protein
MFTLLLQLGERWKVIDDDLWLRSMYERCQQRCQQNRPAKPSSNRRARTLLPQQGMSLAERCLIGMFSSPLSLRIGSVKAIKMHSSLQMVDRPRDRRQYHDSQWMLLVLRKRTVHSYSTRAICSCTWRD